MNLEQIDTSTTAGKAEVMRLAAEGRHIAIDYQDGRGWQVWGVDNDIEWNWGSQSFAIIAALTPQWQPIESAPKDGAFYIATNGKEQRVENCPEGHVAGIWHRINGDWRGSALGDDSTHWQPLPAPPEAPNVND